MFKIKGEYTKDAYQKLISEYYANAKTIKAILAEKRNLTDNDKELIAITKAQSNELKKIDASIPRYYTEGGNYVLE